MKTGAWPVAVGVFALSATHMAVAQEPRLTITFTATTEELTPFADSARLIWERDGARIIQAMEDVSGLRFQETEISAIMQGSPSSSGAAVRTSPMRLFVRYPISMSLIHELGHRLNQQIKTLPDDMKSGSAGLDAHRVLYLYLYDVWVRVYGEEVARRWLEIERGWAALGFTFIKDAWDWALDLGNEGRAAKLREIVVGDIHAPAG